MEVGEFEEAVKCFDEILKLDEMPTVCGIIKNFNFKPADAAYDNE